MNVFQKSAITLAVLGALAWMVKPSEQRTVPERLQKAPAPVPTPSPVLTAENSTKAPRKLKAKPVHSELPMVTTLILSPAPAEPEKSEPLPDLGAPKSDISIIPSRLGLDIKKADSVSRFSAHVDASNATGTSLGISGSHLFGDAVVVGGGAQRNAQAGTVYINGGAKLSQHQELILSATAQQQDMQFGFVSGSVQAGIDQYGQAISYRIGGYDEIDAIDVTAYMARSASKDMGALNYVIDTATLYHLLTDNRRIAGGTLSGTKIGMSLFPWTTSKLSISAGQESLVYDVLSGSDRTDRFAGSLSISQLISDRMLFTVGAATGAAATQYSENLDWSLSEGGVVGLSFAQVNGDSGAQSDRRVQLSLSMSLDKEKIRHQFLTHSFAANILDTAAARPAWLPMVLAKVDGTVSQTSLIYINKPGLPVNSTVDSVGIITIPLNIAPTSILSIVNSTGAAANLPAGAIVLSSNLLVINPSLIPQPAAGATQIYTITISTASGGTSKTTITITHGSVKVDSIVVGQVAQPVTPSPAPAPIPTAPVASAVGISGGTTQGSVLTGSYIYTDIFGAEATSTYRWLRDGVVIAGATARTYTVAAADAGHSITFEVTPVSVTAPTTGTPVVSSAHAIPSTISTVNGVTYDSSLPTATITLINNAGSLEFYFLLANQAVFPSAASVTLATPSITASVGLPTAMVISNNGAWYPLNNPTGTYVALVKNAAGIVIANTLIVVP